MHNSHPPAGSGSTSAADDDSPPSLDIKAPSPAAPPTAEKDEVRFDVERWFKKCSPEQLAHSDARALVKHIAAGHAPYTSFVACRRGNATGEVVVFDVEVEVPQHPHHDIRGIERIGVYFEQDVDRPLEVWALRDSFPTDAPHLNQRDYDYPRSLCLYDVPFRDVRAQWTAGRFVALIREWLRLTARGELHADDQPLERLLMNTEATLVLPRAIRNAAAGEIMSLSLEDRSSDRDDLLFVAQIAERGSTTNGPIAVVLRVRPRVHGPVRRTPRTLAELHGLLAPGGDDLLGTLRTYLKPYASDAARLEARCFIVLLVPKQRTAGGPTESTETWAFLVGTNVRDIGEAVGLWTTTEGVFGSLLWPDPEDDGRSVRIGLAAVRYTVSRDDLARLNGHATADERRIVLIGGGAIGSQIMFNAARAGQGWWTVIDDDRLLPHNLARHALLHAAVGYPKATSLEVLTNLLTDDANVHGSVDADILAPGVKVDEMRTALASADLIVDCSASVTVGRYLARDLDVTARRCSLFLNPSGNDLTLLAEDAERTVRLDALEMQYYRAVAVRPDLAGALAASQSRVRYGRSCRDVSAILPQALVSLYAGVGTVAVGHVVSAATAELRVWRLDPSTLGVTAVKVPIAPVRHARANGWEIVTDGDVLRKLAELREAKLPRETGGVLVGTYDLTRRVLYIVDVIPSPMDSEEQPTSYIRGVEGLTESVERITAATAGQLHYVGEWHSHPVGHSCLPSAKDRALFTWIAEELAKDGLPGLMIIVGDSRLAVPYVERLGDGTAYPAELRGGTTDTEGSQGREPDSRLSVGSADDVSQGG